MIQLTRTYKDFNGNERTENCLFNLTEAEVLDLELSENGGLSEVMKLLAEKQDIKRVVKIFKSIFNMSYGEKSPDGRTFEKTPEILSKFMSTQVYSDIYYELVTDADKAAAFINGVIPTSLRDKMNEKQSEEKGPVVVQ